MEAAGAEFSFRESGWEERAGWGGGYGTERRLPVLNI